MNKVEVLAPLMQTEIYVDLHVSASGNADTGAALSHTTLRRNERWAKGRQVFRAVRVQRKRQIRQRTCDARMATVMRFKVVEDAQVVFTQSCD